MALRESAFSSTCVSGLHAVGWALVFPSFWFLDRLLAGCKSTTCERRARRDQECYLHPLLVFFGSLLFLTLFLVWAPLALLGFLLWAPLQAARRPFRYHRGEPTLRGAERNGTWRAAGRVSLGFATANLCLLPDSLARFNNLGETQRRAAAIGGSIVQGVTRPHIRIYVDSPSSCGTLSPSSSLLTSHNAPGSYGATQTQAPPPAAADPSSTSSSEENPPQEDVAPTPPSPGSGSAVMAPCYDDPVANSNQNSSLPDVRVVGSDMGGDVGSKRRHPPRALGRSGATRADADVPMEVSPMFPAGVDLLCLQEVFDKRAAETLRRSLAPLYGHVLYDVGMYACAPGCGSFKFFNSGLFLASQHPLLDAQYHCFPNARGEDALAAKGLLCVKVQIQLPDQGNQRMVGYFNCTHLHAPEGDGAVRYEQLNMVLKWIDEFQEAHSEEGEMVLFDVLCGDFNFDNCSPDDVLEQKHSVFNQYRDPCRVGPGQDKPWVIGTLLEQPTLYDEEVRTPDSLQRTLEREDLRKQYLSPPVAQGGAAVTCLEDGRPWIGRRLDYVLYRESTTAKNTHAEVEEFTYVTQLAGLTDHIPVGLRLGVCLPTDEP
ncbi:sphingomyelin phosphodiesterase 5 [Alosa sapidissima]|uniref:sphingomyelin phosphodiesterase 5 n=1 Tax=Alosa sapidissima TaxID=34773 RepID=UPI001C082A20|nr:sphingomyelin phosphodiesterase 5 [Alosa sapidissima]XP_041963189.1 sphingomyelin phosphodiesterase 5 [Alosa sapidissima]XP_041963190.1 sphingomyelin phosphodiesterase 5 [Alosa sapidissima]XP_041963191.1 sphingomyelin phosphodiesterase 5 [Alosa sapidissima]